MTPGWKFLLSMMTLLVINKELAYMERICSMPIVLVAALFCSFMPTNFIVVVAALFVVLHVYALSLPAACVVVLLLLVLFLLYFRFSAKDTVAAAITPILWVWKIPYIAPIICGLLGTPASAVSVGSGTILYYVLKVIKKNEMTLSTSEKDDILIQFRMIIDEILHNREMYVALAAFSITIILVYLIRRLSINYAWMIAMIAGAITNCLICFMGALVFGSDISVAFVLIGNVLAIGVAKVAEFFWFNVDYNRTEYVQFEDDEYYYYVKAVPKNVVAKPEKSVKKVSSTTRPLPVSEIKSQRRVAENTVSNRDGRGVRTSNLSGASQRNVKIYEERTLQNRTTKPEQTKK